MQTHNHPNILSLNSDQLAIKDLMINELSIDNRRVKEDLAKTHYQRSSLSKIFHVSRDPFMVSALSTITETFFIVLKSTLE